MKYYLKIIIILKINFMINIQYIIYNLFINEDFYSYLSQESLKYFDKVIEKKTRNWLILLKLKKKIKKMNQIYLERMIKKDK